MSRRHRFQSPLLLPSWHWVAPMALVLGVLAWSAPGVAHPPGADSRAGTPVPSVLVLSQLSEAEDSNVMRSLEVTLEGAGAHVPWRLTRLGLASDDSLPEGIFAAKLRSALQSAPGALIVTTTATVTDLVASLEPTRPILFRMAADPMELCLVDSLRKPGHNATGYTSAIPVDSKQIEVLLMSYPAIKTVVMLLDDESDDNLQGCQQGDLPLSTARSKPCKPGWVQSYHQGGAAAAGGKALGLLGAERSLRYLRLCTRQDLDRLGLWLGTQGASGVVVPYTSFFYFEIDAMVKAARRLRLPAVYRDPAATRHGGLMVVAPVEELPGRARGMEQARRLLSGVSPAEIPVQRPEGLAWTLNLRAAREAGLIPSKSALRAADHLVH